MTPKEKAKQLVDRFSTVGLQQREEGYQCASIAVDEILEWSSQWSGLHNEISYWHEVKKEIEAL
jgi:hypothetical protein